MESGLPASNFRDPGAPPQPPSPQGIQGVATAVFEPASSVSGMLAGCIQGYVSRSSNEAIAIPVGMMLEITQYPDGIRRSTTGIAPIQMHGEHCDFGFSVEWAKLINMNLVFSFQQVGFIGMIYVV